MRILHLLHQYLPEHVGGTELYTQGLARFQAQEQGHEVSLFYPVESASPREQTEGLVNLYGAPAGPRSRTGVFLSTFGEKAVTQAFARQLALAHLDVVHIQHLMGLPLELINQVQRAQIPFVLTLHDYWYPCANAQLITNYDNQVCAGPAWWINCGRCALARAGWQQTALLAPALAPVMAYRSYRLRQVLEKAAAIIAPTNFVKETYAQLGMPTERVTVIPHGIEIPSNVTLARGQSQLITGELHIVYVGSIAWQKGVHTLVEAVNQLPHEGIRLSIFGSLDSFPDYSAHLQQVARHPGIHFAGRIDRPALWQMLLTEADVLVVPSLWYETASLVIQEAFAARVPVIASRLGALAERITDGLNGYHFPAGDVGRLRELLQQLYAEPARLKKLRAGIRPVRLIEEHAADVEAVYRRVLEENALS